MKFVLNIDCGNAAFDPDPVPEVARILREVADRLESGAFPRNSVNVRDINGNTVGTFRLTGRR